MNQKIAQITLLVNNYEKAIAFYTQKLNFKLVENTDLGNNKRWVLISPIGNSTFNLLLAKADGEIQQKFVGNQAGGRVFLFLHTDNFKRDYENLISEKIKIIREPKTEPYGKVVVFADLYGNLWDLIEPSKK